MKKYILILFVFIGLCAGYGQQSRPALKVSSSKGPKIEESDIALKMPYQYYYFTDDVVDGDEVRRLHCYYPKTEVDVTLDLPIYDWSFMVEASWYDKANDCAYIAINSGGLEIRELTIYKITKKNSVSVEMQLEGYAPRAYNNYDTSMQCYATLNDQFVRIKGYKDGLEVNGLYNLDLTPVTLNSPFNGRWIKFNNNGPLYSLDFNFYDYSEDPDIIGSFLEENCMDCYPWKLRKSKIISEDENSISFSVNDNGAATLTMTYDSLKQNVIVALDGDPMATFNEDTNKLKYWYARQNAEVVRNQDGTSVIGHVKAGDRFELKKWVNPFLENYIQIKLPDNTYVWIKSDQIEEGVAEPIKSKAFPLTWIYEDDLGEQTIKIKKTGGGKVLVDYVDIKYSKAGERTSRNEEIQYSGSIKGNRITLTKYRPLYFKGSFTKLPETKEIVLIPNIYVQGMWRTRLLFEGHEFIPTFIKKLNESVFH